MQSVFQLIPKVLSGVEGRVPCRTSRSFTPDIQTISTGVLHGCVLSPFLFSLYAIDCISRELTVMILRFADDKTMVGLITYSDESTYRKEVEQLDSWNSHNHLPVEMVVDFRCYFPLSHCSTSVIAL